MRKTPSAEVSVAPADGILRSTGLLVTWRTWSAGGLKAKVDLRLACHVWAQCNPLPQHGHSGRSPGYHESLYLVPQWAAGREIASSTLRSRPPEGLDPNHDRPDRQLLRSTCCAAQAASGEGSHRPCLFPGAVASRPRVIASPAAALRRRPTRSTRPTRRASWVTASVMVRAPVVVRGETPGWCV